MTTDVKNYTEFQWRQPPYTFTFTYRINERKMTEEKTAEETIMGVMMKN